MKWSIWVYFYAAANKKIIKRKSNRTIELAFQDIKIQQYFLQVVSFFFMSMRVRWVNLACGPFSRL